MKFNYSKTQSLSFFAGILFLMSSNINAKENNTFTEVETKIVSPEHIQAISKFDCFQYFDNKEAQEPIALNQKLINRNYRVKYVLFDGWVVLEKGCNLYYYHHLSQNKPLPINYKNSYL